MTAPSLDYSHLSPEERLQLVEDLWDSLVRAGPGTVPLPGWHREVVAERLAAWRRDGDPGRPWQEVLDAIDEELTGRPASSPG